MNIIFFVFYFLTFVCDHKIMCLDERDIQPFALISVIYTERNIAFD